MRWKLGTLHTEKWIWNRLGLNGSYWSLQTTQRQYSWPERKYGKLNKIWHIWFQLYKVLTTVYCKWVGRDSSVGIATRHRLEGPGIESRWSGEIFRNRPDRPMGPPSLLYSGYQVYFPGIKRTWRGVDHTTPSNAEVKERVEQYISTPLWNFVTCYRVNFKFTLPILKEITYFEQCLLC